MKNLFASLSVLVLMASPTYAGQSVPCNPATGNWIDAAPITCPDFGSGMQRPSPVKVVVVVPPPPPPPPKEDEEVETVY